MTPAARQKLTLLSVLQPPKQGLGSTKEQIGKYLACEMHYAIEQDKFYAQAHCNVCSSSFSSGDWVKTGSAAAKRALLGLAEHCASYPGGSCMRDTSEAIISAKIAAAQKLLSK